MSNDAKTVLNPPLLPGGDAMDESAHTSSLGVVKRPRVNVGFEGATSGDPGTLQTATLVSSRVAADVAIAASSQLDSMISQLQTLNSLVPSVYDEVDLTYDVANNLTLAVFKHGATTVSTLTLTYDGSNNLTRVVKT